MLVACVASSALAEPGFSVSGLVGVGFGSEESTTGGAQFLLRTMREGRIVGMGVEVASGLPEEDPPFLCFFDCPRVSRRRQHASLVLTTQNPGPTFGILGIGLYDHVLRIEHSAPLPPETEHTISFGGSMGLGLAARGRVAPIGEVRLHLVRSGGTGSGPVDLETQCVASLGLRTRF